MDFNYGKEGYGKDKEKLDFFKQDKENNSNILAYRLPDGNSVKLGSEKTKAPEILFKPELIGLEYPGVTEMVTSCI